MTNKFLKKILSPPSLLTADSGFTLLEVVIAMAIMAICFGSILAVEGGAINASTRAKQMGAVATLARNQMIETEYKIEGKKFEEVKKEDQGVFKEPYQDYSWKRVIKEVTLPNITSMLSGGNKGRDSSSAKDGPNQNAEMLGKLLTKFLSKALREVTVTILWKKGGNQLNYSVSTYWVDLNYEFSTTE
ncbi:MAG: prepilin-type N-terminal cleavage/methylation domain-containing protein [Bdellovibrionia bacterium]